MMQLLIEGQNNIIETFKNNTEIIKRLAQALDQQGLNKYDSDVLFILLQDKILEVNILELLLKESKISGYSRNKVNEVIKNMKAN